MTFIFCLLFLSRRVRVRWSDAGEEDHDRFVGDSQHDDVVAHSGAIAPGGALVAPLSAHDPHPPGLDVRLLRGL